MYSRTWKSRLRSAGFRLVRILILSAVLILLSALILSHFFEFAVVRGESMSPSFRDAQRLLLEPERPIARFDVIVFHPPHMRDTLFMKRVIGLPGDKLHQHFGAFEINGVAYDPKRYGYEVEMSPGEGDWIVPHDCYFVAGDNRWVSEDSRHFGFVAKDAIVGVVSCRFWPPWRFRFY